MATSTVLVRLNQEFTDDVMKDAAARGVTLKTRAAYEAYAMQYLTEASRQLGRKRFIRMMTRGMRIPRRDIDSVELKVEFDLPKSLQFGA